MNDCVFCQIAKHEAPARIIYEDELVIAILDIDPISDGHTLIIPKKDVPNIHSLDSETGKRVMEVAKMLAGAIEQEFGFEGSMIMEVNGVFQDVPHFHLHVFGRNRSDDIKFSYPKHTNSSDEQVAENASRLQERMSGLIPVGHTIKIFDLSSQEDKHLLDKIIIPIQTHSTNITEIKTGREDLQNCDGMFTSNENNLSLGIQTADCAAICFSDNKKYGIIHAGWRGLVNGIIEKMLDNFVNPNIFVSPVLNEFEIQKDDCYEKIYHKFGGKYFHLREENDKVVIIFKFLEALKSVLPTSAVFDSRDTFKNSNLASWRRDHDDKRNYTIIYGENHS